MYFRNDEFMSQYEQQVPSMQQPIPQQMMNAQNYMMPFCPMGPACPLAQMCPIAKDNINMANYANESQNEISRQYHIHHPNPNFHMQHFNPNPYHHMQHFNPHFHPHFNPFFNPFFFVPFYNGMNTDNYDNDYYNNHNENDYNNHNNY